MVLDERGILRYPDGLMQNSATRLAGGLAVALGAAAGPWCFVSHAADTPPPLQLERPGSPLVASNLNQLGPGGLFFKPGSEDAFKPLDSGSPLKSLDAVVQPLPFRPANNTPDAKMRDKIDAEKNWMFKGMMDLKGNDQDMQKAFGIKSYDQDGNHQTDGGVIGLFYKRLGEDADKKNKPGLAEATARFELGRELDPAGTNALNARLFSLPGGGETNSDYSPSGGGRNGDAMPPGFPGGPANAAAEQARELQRRSDFRQVLYGPAPAGSSPFDRGNFAPPDRLGGRGDFGRPGGLDVFSSPPAAPPPAFAPPPGPPPDYRGFASPVANPALQMPDLRSRAFDDPATRAFGAQPVLPTPAPSFETPRKSPAASAYETPLPVRKF